MFRQMIALRTLFTGVEIALNDIQRSKVNIEKIRDCLGNVDILCEKTLDTLGQLDRLVSSVKRTSNNSPRDGLVITKWLINRSEINRLQTQLMNLTSSLAIALQILQGVHCNIKIDLVLSQIKVPVEESELTATYRDDASGLNSQLQQSAGDLMTSTEAPVSRNVPDAQMRSESTSSTKWSCGDTISETALPQKDPLSQGLPDPNGTSTSFGTLSGTFGDCELFCQCHCHTSIRARTPRWTDHLMGSFIFHGSINLRRPPCDRKQCRGPRPLRVQVSYVVPCWMFLNSLVIHMQGEMLKGKISCNLTTPKIIPSTAEVWSIVELGKICELRHLFSDRSLSPYAVDPHGITLLRYAAMKGQNEIYSLLLAENADQRLRDSLGFMDAQPGIDRVLSDLSSKGHLFTRTNTSDQIYITSENLDQQNFTSLHLIILGLVQIELEPSLKYHRLDVNAQDSNGRTPLLWAAWRGDGDSANLLLNYGADCDKADNAGYTPLAKACESGHLVVAQLLLKAGASVQCRTLRGDDQPIHLASRNLNNGHQIVEELMRYNADPMTMSSGSGTPLHNACNCGSLQTMKVLLSVGADINALGENRDTPVMESLYCWNEAAFLYLAQDGAKLDIVNGSGHNVLLVATWSASIVAWETIIEYADRGKLGFIDVNVPHNGHDIHHCFDRCRDLWFVGQRAEKDVEKAVFLRMVRACSLASQAISVNQSQHL
ncbi:hypothetical protein DPSP01_006599 [Paraphaeosphaeria sporulosa]